MFSCFMVTQMPEQLRLVVPKTSAISEQEYHAALVAGLARVAAGMGRGNLADKSQRTPRALGKLFSGDAMDTTGKGLLDFLLADPTALDEALSLYGFGIHRLDNSGTDNGARMADVLDFATTDAAFQAAGRSDHRSICQLADKARPVVQHCMGIVARADRIKGVRAA